MSNTVVMDTSHGVIELELHADQAPKTVANFLGYVDAGHYDGLIFHRVIPDFMIQCGGFEPGMGQKKTNPPVANESSNGLSNAKGTVAMARTAVPDSATSQFFINLKDNTFLDQASAADGVGYCVFGKVTAGMDVVDKIKGVRTATVAGHQNVPAEDVVIKSVTRKKKG